MLRHKGYLLKLAVLTWIMLYCLSAINRVLLPKYFYNASWATTSAYMDFYHMERDTIDVLFLGSSHCTAAFSPVEIYEKYGIRSYNLGCEQQNLLLSYYWLQEALRFQNPKLVVLDTFMLFSYDTQAALNTSEATTRKAMDFMRWSGVKIKAVRDICSSDQGQEPSSYLFPNIRFHTRWKWLTEDDFSVASMGKHVSLMGFFPLRFACEDDSYRPFCADTRAGCAEMVPLMKEYLDKIVELCAEHDMELVLVKTPTMFYSQEAHNAVYRYAKEKDLVYLDFNEETVFHDAGLEFALDSCDTDHVSVSGAMKISDYIGDWLLDKVSHGWEDTQWEIRALYYEHCQKDENLGKETELRRYLQSLQDENYSILISVMGDASEIFRIAAPEEFHDLGLSPERAEEYGVSYYAVIDAGKILAEEAGDKALNRQGTVRKGLVKYDILSGGANGGNACSILLNEREAALGEPGLNIVVYCNDEKKLIDRVCFRMEQGEIKCFR